VRPLVFVIPTFNEPDADIEKSIDSVMALRCDTRAIVVDDKSTLPPFGGRTFGDDKIVIVRRDKNGRPPAALNTGIREAMSRFGNCYLSRLDVGDTVLAERADQLEWHAAGGFHASWSHWVDRISGLERRTDEKWRRSIFRDCQFTLLSCIWDAYAWSTAGGFDESLPWCHDWDFCLKVHDAVGWQGYEAPTVLAGVMPGGWTAQAMASDEARARRDKCHTTVIRRARTMRTRHRAAPR